jgi:hypothetical protein
MARGEYGLNETIRFGFAPYFALQSSATQFPFLCRIEKRARNPARRLGAMSGHVEGMSLHAIASIGSAGYQTRPPSQVRPDFACAQ